jgi:hypothetical protein
VPEIFMIGQPLACGLLFICSPDHPIAALAQPVSFAILNLVSARLFEQILTGSIPTLQGPTHHGAMGRGRLR